MFSFLVPYLSKPLIKYGVPALLIVLVLSWSHWEAYSKGKDVIQHEWDAAVGAQAAESLKQVAEAYRARDDAYKTRDEILQQVTARESTLQQKLVSYERSAKQSKPCPAPVGSVELFPSVVSVLDTATQRVPTADAPTGTVDAAPSADVEAAAVLHGYVEALADVTGQLSTLWVDYNGLVQERRGQYIVETARYNQTD